jgi:hypothetical protein
VRPPTISLCQPQKLTFIISIFYIISLTIFGIRITRHRNSGGQSTQLPYDAVAQTAAEQEKVQPQAQAYPVSEGASTVQTQQQLYGGYYQPQAQPQPQPHQA